MPSTRIITHRGLDPSVPGFPMESSLEAFRAHLDRGYGLEFDVRRTADDRLVVVHDSDLKRVSGGADVRKISELTLAEITSMDFGGNHLGSFEEVLGEIVRGQAPSAISAIHLKSVSQEHSTLGLVLGGLASSGISTDAFLLFDAKVATAQYLKDKNPALHIAPSVAHPYDIARYNSVVGETLLSVEDVLAHRDIFDWVWLDEWDLADAVGTHKKFYTQEVFQTFHDAGIKVALVTPELHGTSPGLLGGEAHEDARDHEILMTRIKEILSYGPDAVCTDYPDMVHNLALKP